MAKEIKKYDVKENVIYLKRLDGLEIWHEYDERNNLIHSKFYGGETWREYNADNQEIHYKESGPDGVELWYRYENGERIIIEKDENGNVISEEKE